MRRVENDRRPPLGRLYDLERWRQFAIKLGHRQSPSLESASSGYVISARKRSFCEAALSIITTVLPSEKTLKSAGTSLDRRSKVLWRRKIAVFIALKWHPVQK